MMDQEIYYWIMKNAAVEEKDFLYYATVTLPDGYTVTDCGLTEGGAKNGLATKLSTDFRFRLRYQRFEAVNTVAENKGGLSCQAHLSNMLYVVRKQVQEIDPEPVVTRVYPPRYGKELVPTPHSPTFWTKDYPPHS